MRLPEFLIRLFVKIFKRDVLLLWGLIFIAPIKSPDDKKIDQNRNKTENQKEDKYLRKERHFWSLLRKLFSLNLNSIESSCRVFDHARSRLFWFLKLIRRSRFKLNWIIILEFNIYCRLFRTMGKMIYKQITYSKNSRQKRKKN